MKIHGSLFSGAGGFDVAAELMGWENKFHCEWDKFCQQVLKYYWPNATQYGDIDKTDFTIWRGLIDVLSGGFPCQPYSAAGKRKGKEDNRHKWPQMLRAIREIQPGWVVGENVRGLTNWSGGLVFDEVQADLETEGYEVLPFLLPACAVNAPHRRDRIWFVAYSNAARQRRDERKKEIEGNVIANCSSKHSPLPIQQRGQDETGNINIDWKGNERDVANAYSGIGREGRLYEAESETTEGHTGTRNARIIERGTWDNFPTQPPVRSRNDGLPSRLSGITLPKHRNESIKAYGNSVVPQVVYQIFKAIEQYESQKTEQDYLSFISK